MPNDKDSETSRTARPGLDLGSVIAQLSLLSSAVALEQKKNQLVKELERLGQSQRNTLSANDDRRTTMLTDEFHHKFVGWMREVIQKRPSIADQAYCKARCEEPTFREGYQHGVSMCLSILGTSIWQYHKAGLSEEAKSTKYYPIYPELPKLKLTNSDQEMLGPGLGKKQMGLFRR